MGILTQRLIIIGVLFNIILGFVLTTYSDATLRYQMLEVEEMKTTFENEVAKGTPEETESQADRSGISVWDNVLKAGNMLLSISNMFIKGLFFFMINEDDYELDTFVEEYAFTFFKLFNVLFNFLIIFEIVQVVRGVKTGG